jgi:hypothetical protein
MDNIKAAHTEQKRKQALVLMVIPQLSVVGAICAVDKTVSSGRSRSVVFAADFVGVQEEFCPVFAD